MHSLRNMKSRWCVVTRRADGTTDYLTPPMMPDGEREWGDYAERSVFASHERAKEEAGYHGGEVSSS